MIDSGAVPQLDGDYRWKAAQMERMLAGLISDERKARARVLEVGCGPVGIVSRLPWGERHAVDPLNDFFQGHPTLSQCRDPSVHYQKAMGEELPFDPAMFDLVVLENVLDHVQGAPRLLGEVGRVLKEDGVLYLTVNVRTPWGVALHSVLSRLLIDKGHPYSFTASSLRQLVRRQGFSIKREQLEDHRRARASDRRSRFWKDRIKGFTGLSEFVLSGVLSKA
ncbi:MAG: class I SAM-dependent methyltransferase [Terriglobales bacterium]